MNKTDVLIVGGGASGLAAAIELKRHTNLCVVVLEKLDRVGKKILATGNGRCNLLNEKATPEDYNDPDFVEKVFSAYDVQSDMDFFRSMGLLTVTDEAGRVYPRSTAAASVLDVLRLECARLGVEFRLSEAAASIRKKDGLYVVNDIAAKTVIVACGGKAAPAQGSDGSGYALLQHFGHKISPLYPALVQIRTQVDFVKPLKGLRTTAALSLKEKGGSLHRTKGELLFTDYGLSGIAAMELSRFAKEGTAVGIDFVPELSKEDLLSYLRTVRDRNPERPLEQYLVGILHSRIGQALLKDSLNVRLSAPCGSLSDAQLKALAGAIKHTSIPVLGTKGFPDAQVTAGGAVVSQFTDTLESKLSPGLFACGEILHIDGRCGGYNLTFAWSSGRLAGRSAALRCGKDYWKRDLL